jgi:hypothetical protein
MAPNARRACLQDRGQPPRILRRGPFLVVIEVHEHISLFRATIHPSGRSLSLQRLLL